MDEVIPLLRERKTRISLDLIARFDCDAVEQEQGRHDGTNHSAKGDRCLMVEGNAVRVVAEISPEWRPMSKAHAIWLDTKGKTALGRGVRHQVGDCDHVILRNVGKPRHWWRHMMRM